MRGSGGPRQLSGHIVAQEWHRSGTGMPPGHTQFLQPRDIYCRMPARWGLQQTHPGLQAATRHGARDPLVRPQKFKSNKPHV